MPLQSLPSDAHAFCPKNINKGGRKRGEKRRRAALDDDPEFLGSFLASDVSSAAQRTSRRRNLQLSTESAGANISETTTSDEFVKLAPLFWDATGSY